MRTDDFITAAHAKLRQLVAQSRACRIVVAYSGGIDSTVLLHLLSRATFATPIKLFAVHVNHGIDAAADQWQLYCQNVAKDWSLAFKALSVEVARTHRQGLEAAARSARYQTLRAQLASGDLLVTAHHSGDQAETVLLRLVRGAGVAGLSAIAEYFPFGKGVLARPLLGFSRSDIEAYAKQHRLHWIEDPSNADLSYDRNYLRHRVTPALRQRWQAWDTTLARAARHQSQADTLLGLEAARWLARCMPSGSHHLSHKAFISLATAYQKPVLRAWLAMHDMPIPDESQLNYLHDKVTLSAQARNAEIFSWAGATVHLYRGLLYASRGIAKVPEQRLEWQPRVDFLLPENGIKLRWTELIRQAPALAETALSVDFRRGGERCARAGGRFHQSLKKIFQSYHVPPWQRDYVPLIYAEGRIRLIWNILRCD